MHATITQSTCRLLGALAAVLVASASPAAEAPGGAEGPPIIERSFSTFQDFEECLHGPEIDIHGSKGFVTLADEEYLVDSRGNQGTYEKSPPHLKRMRLGPSLLAKKRFHLDAVEAKAVELFFCGRVDKASLNGRPIEFGKFVHHGGWCRAEVDASCLRAGENDLVLYAGLSLFQDRQIAPAKNSFTSRDGGATWQRAEDGELLVNIRLRRHPAQGVVTSPVVDLANPGPRNVICPLLRLTRVDVASLISTPEGTAAVLEVRSGNTPWPDETWSPWSPGRTPPPQRYVQWRAILTTRNRERTPVLASVTVRAEAATLAEAARQGLSVAALHSPKIIRGSFPYEFQRPSANLKRLRDEYKLDDVVAAGKTEWDQLVLLRNWIRRRWPQNDAGAGERSWNAMEILGAPPGHHGMCVHYATAFVQCALALGFNARPIILHNHFVADVWSEQYQTWALMDVETAFAGYGTSHYVHPRTRRPLTCLEVHGALHRALDEDKTAVDGMIQAYYGDTEAGEHVRQDIVRPTDSSQVRAYTSFAYPPRNNYLDRLDPWEEYHGYEVYHSNDYWWWASDWPRGAEPQYPLKTRRAADLYWTLNQAAITLSATATPATLAVAVDTVTPNLLGFAYQIDNGAWVSLPGDGRDPDSRRAAFAWPLHPGSNRLRVKTVNQFGREGSPSYVVVNAPKDSRSGAADR